VITTWAGLWLVLWGRAKLELVLVFNNSARYVHRCRGSSIIRRFDSPQFLASFYIHFYRCWLGLYISSQLRVRLELMKMHVAVCTFGQSKFRIINTQTDTSIDACLWRFADIGFKMSDLNGLNYGFEVHENPGQRQQQQLEMLPDNLLMDMIQRTAQELNISLPSFFPFFHTTRTQVSGGRRESRRTGETQNNQRATSN